MDRFDQIVHKARFDRIVEIGKANPYHDPKTGRFTTANGGGAGGISFSAASTKAEAREYARTQLGFSGTVDYSYSYIDQKTVQQVFGELDLETVNHVNKTITEIQERYPELKGAVTNLGVSTRSVYAEVVYSGRDGSASLMIGAKAYGKGLQSVYDSYAEDVDLGYHPKGTTGDAILWHEYGHVYAGIGNEKACGSMLNVRNKMSAIHNNVAENEWRNTAISKMLSDSKLKAEHDMLGLEFSAQALSASFNRKVSGYATKDNGELFAEAFAAHNTGNGNRWTDALMEAAGADRRK